MFQIKKNNEEIVATELVSDNVHQTMVNIIHSELRELYGDHPLTDAFLYMADKYYKLPDDQFHNQALAGLYHKRDNVYYVYFDEEINCSEKTLVSSYHIIDPVDQLSPAARDIINLLRDTEEYNDLMLEFLRRGYNTSINKTSSKKFFCLPEWMITYEMYDWLITNRKIGILDCSGSKHMSDALYVKYIKSIGSRKCYAHVAIKLLYASSSRYGNLQQGYIKNKEYIIQKMIEIVQLAEQK